MTIVQLCPQLNIGGVERGVVDVAAYLQKMGCNSIVVSNGGRLVSELESNQVKHIQLPIHSKNPFHFLLNLWRLNHLLRNLKPDLLLPYSRMPTWLIYCLGKKNKIPFISHCLGIHRMGLLGLKTKYNSVLMCGDRIIANSHFTKSYFLRHFPHCRRDITVIPRSVDTLIFNQSNNLDEITQSLRKKWQVKATQTVILLPARITYWKGHDVLISALDLMKRISKINFYVVMMGECQTNSSYYKQLMARISDLNLVNNVFFTDATTTIRDAYAAADIVVSTSTEPEAFGRTIIEAQAMGKIVVASGHGGALETIENNGTGFLVEPENAEALAHTLIMIHQMDPVKKAEISLNAIKSAHNFSKEKMCGRLMDVYCELVKDISRVN